MVEICGLLSPPVILFVVDNARSRSLSVVQLSLSSYPTSLVGIDPQPCEREKTKPSQDLKWQERAP